MKKYFFISVFVLISTALVGQELQNFRPQQVVSPEISGGRVTFRIHAPAANQVRLSGSWMRPPDTEALTKNAEGVWSITINAPPPEIYTYNFIVDGVSVNDAANIFVQRDGRRFLSVLLIDGALTANYREANKRGNVEHVWYDSPTLGITRRMLVYTPHGYAGSNQRYPVLYLLHGGGGDEEAWSSMGRARQILDNLIEQGKATPMIVAMPNGNAGQQAAQTLMLPERTNSPSGPSANADMENSFPDIIKFVESNYRVQNEKSHRAIAGLSMGGGHTVRISAMYPNTFDYIGVFSIPPFLRFIGDTDTEFYDRLEEQFRAQNRNGFKLYWMACGTEDFLFEYVKESRTRMDAIGFNYIYRETGGGHTWSVWRQYLVEFLPQLFK